MDPNQPRWLKPLVVGALVVLAIWPFVADARREARVPEDTIVAEGVQAIRAGFQPGDGVIVTPTWYTLPWHGLEGMGEGTMVWPYPALLLSEDLDPIEALTYGRLWVLAAFGRDAELPAVLDGVATGRTDVWAGEDVAVARFDVPKLERLKTMTRDRAEVVVRRGPSEALAACKYRGDRHRCNKDGWLDVRLEDRIVHHHQVQWLFVHASPAGQIAELTWPKLPSGGAWYFLRAGWTMEAVRHEEGKTTTVVVLRDGHEIDRFALDPHDYWLERRAYRLGGDGETSITLQVLTEDNGHRELMVEADVLATLPDAVRRWATHVAE